MLQKNSLLDDVIEPAIAALQTASGLTRNAAKTLVYYAVVTYGLEELRLCAALVLQGATGTGKSGAMNVEKELVNKPHSVGTNLTKARLRDEFGKAKNATAFIEEGDNASEELISNRFSRDTATTSVNRTTGVAWSPWALEYFGATVMHKRKPFNDPATASRSIVVKTHSSPGSYYMPQIENSIRESLRNLWLQAKDKLVTLNYPGRAGDAWKPLIAVAITCGDGDWLAYAMGELDKATQKLKLGQDFEPEALVVNTLIALSYDKPDNERVALSKIVAKLKLEYNWQPSSWALADIVRDLGFEVKKSNGDIKVQIHRSKLTDVCEQLGIEAPTFEVEISSRNLQSYG